MGRRLWVEGEIARRRDRDEARSHGGEIEQRRDQVAQCDRRGAVIDETGAIWCMRSSDWSSGFAGDVEGVIWASSRALSLSLYASDPEMV